MVNKAKCLHYNNIKDYSPNQLVYYCCCEAKEKASVSGLLWNLVLVRSTEAYPRMSCYDGANELLRTNKLNTAKRVAFLVDYFWAILKHN